VDCYTLGADGTLPYVLYVGKVSESEITRTELSQLSYLTGQYNLMNSATLITPLQSPSALTCQDPYDTCRIFAPQYPTMFPNPFIPGKEFFS
jgi:hypothetical protein